MNLGKIDLDHRYEYLLVYRDKRDNSVNTWTLNEAAFRLNYKQMKASGNVEFLAIYQKLSDSQVLNIMQDDNETEVIHMEKFRVGDKVYADDWCYGEIVEIEGNTAYVQFETERGGGCLNFELSELRHEKWCITTDYYNKKKIDYLAWQSYGGYFWTHREAFEKILHHSTPDHPFLFNTRREAIRHLKSIDIPQKCRIIRW